MIQTPYSYLYIMLYFCYKKILLPSWHAEMFFVPFFCRHFVVGWNLQLNLSTRRGSESYTNPLQSPMTTCMADYSVINCCFPFWRVYTLVGLQQNCDICTFLLARPAARHLLTRLAFLSFRYFYVVLFLTSIYS